MNGNDQQTGSTSLVSGILVVSGILLLVAGAFVALFVNVVVGVVLLVAGLLDLAMSVLLPKMVESNRQQ